MNHSSTTPHDETQSGKLILPADTDLDVWRKARMSGIGASEIGAVMGLNPYRSALKVWLTKTGREAEFEGNAKTRWGSRQEALICDDFAEQTGKTLRETGLWQSNYLRWEIATPDRLIESPFNELVEAKNVGPYSAHHWDCGVPSYCYAQVQQQLDVTGRTRGYVAAAIAGDPPRVWAIDRDEEFIDRIREAGERFWWHVETDTTPPVGDAPVPDIAKAHPTQPGTEIELDFEAEVLHATYVDARAVETEAGKRKKEAGRQLRPLMGTAQRGILGGREAVTITTPKPRKKIDEERLAKEDPDIYNKYLIEVPVSPQMNIK